MKWIEIINARINSSANPFEMENIFQEIRSNVSEDRMKGLRIAFYRGGTVDSDWAVHLYHETDGSTPGRSGLGIKLAEIFRPMALVDHRTWIEQE